MQVILFVSVDFLLLPSLSDCNWTQTQNHLVRKRTLNHLDSSLLDFDNETKVVQLDLTTFEKL